MFHVENGVKDGFFRFSGTLNGVKLTNVFWAFQGSECEIKISEDCFYEAPLNGFKSFFHNPNTWKAHEAHVNGDRVKMTMEQFPMSEKQRCLLAQAQKALLELAPKLLEDIKEHKVSHQTDRTWPADVRGWDKAFKTETNTKKEKVETTAPTNHVKIYFSPFGGTPTANKRHK